MPIPPAPAPFLSLHTLVVDDDDHVRDLLTEHLRARGLKVDTAADGAAAIETIERAAGAFGLVFTDLHMPDVDGIAVVQAARSANASAYVVIITGYATLDSAMQAVRLGAYDYLTKPFSLGQIDVILRRIEDRMALEAENRRLLHRIEMRDGDAPHSLQDRLSGLDMRLSTLETMIREILVEVTRRRP